jgi:hypothetical protein
MGNDELRVTNYECTHTLSADDRILGIQTCLRAEKRLQKAGTDCTNFTDPIMPEFGAICEIRGDTSLSFLMSMSATLRMEY